jgi:hypothetical protein
MDPLIGASLIGAGGSLLGGLFGSSSNKKAMKQQAAAMERISKLQEQLFKTSEDVAKPFRDILFPQLETILSGGDVSGLPMYRTRRTGLEEQYQRAGENLRTMAPGGALQRALAELEMGRAEKVGGLPGELYNETMNTGLNLAGLNLNSASLGLANAGNTSSSLFNTLANQQTGYNQMIADAGAGFGSTLYEMMLKGNKNKSVPSPDAWFAPEERW